MRLRDTLRGMRAVNTFTVTRIVDHVLLRFGWCDKPSFNPSKPEELGPDPIEIMIPISTSAAISLALFEGVIQSTLDITAFFANLQPAIGRLNVLSAMVEQEKQKFVPTTMHAETESATESATVAMTHTTKAGE
jgi:hypothetical protein